MTEYEEFQRIMAEIEYKKRMEEAKKKGLPPCDLPPGFEQLFTGFKK